jgi:hypothetical protein
MTGMNDKVFFRAKKSRMILTQIILQTPETKFQSGAFTTTALTIHA